MDSLQVPVEPVPPALDAIRRLLLEARSWLSQDPSRAERCIEGAVKLLPDTAEAQPPGDARPIAGGLAPWQIARLKALVEAGLGERIRSAEMAEAARLSPSHFARAFKRSFGVPPHAYVNRRRIARAKSLMLKTPQSLTTIALACGLADQAHFCRLFRQYEGCSPSAWRRSHAIALAA